MSERLTPRGGPLRRASVLGVSSADGLFLSRVDASGVFPEGKPVGAFTAGRGFRCLLSRHG